MENLSEERKLDVKESDKLADYQVVYEYFLRGFTFERANLYNSEAEDFIIKKNSLLMSLSSIDGVSEAAAKNIVKAREDGKFSSIDDLKNRAGLNRTVITALKTHGCLNGLQESNQMTLF